jgi:hypothetical protein
MERRTRWMDLAPSVRRHVAAVARHHASVGCAADPMGAGPNSSSGSRSGTALALMLSLALIGFPSFARAECPLVKDGVFSHDEIGEIQLSGNPSLPAIAFASQMQVNTDGAPDSYHPDDIGVTHICNGVSTGAGCKWEASCLPRFRQAKAEGFHGPTKVCFFAMATDAQGIPIIQGPSDPNPGYFVSTTALRQPGEDVRTPRAQLDSNTVPFAVIPTTWQSAAEPGARLGDFGVAYRRSTGKVAFFVIGDLGPRRKLGEGSIALHQALGNDPFAMRFGVRRARKGIGGRDVVYLLFPRSARPGERLDAASVERATGPLLDRFGGVEQIKSCLEAGVIR